MKIRSCLAFAGFLALGLFVHLPIARPQPTGPITEKRFPPLKLPPGFKATLFACDPLIEYPSVIAAGPKPGALFVAIDYMTGLGSDGKVKSEIRLVEDTDSDGYADKATIVAKGFNSIQGLSYHDGTLLVMHAPHLTELRPKAQGQPSLGFREGTPLLTGLGLKPEENSSRLHCANGVVVGHDGWLYLAVGDNGIDVVRPEGDRLVYKGGGILRCRPDGRDLHVFSTGLRNIYDIALDAELNVFTRDNENDGGTYMIRVCHCFHGSDHGYPYDYAERPDHAMKPIGDFGLGSSAGGVCYLETQFPREYRGNLFFCEWGKSVVRYEPKRSGGGFGPVKEFEFATGDPKDAYPFKPTDIVVQRDGTLMVSDYADGQRPKRGRGRIYHIAYVGQDSDPFKKKAIGLDSESYHERCEAQRALEQSGKKPVMEKLGPRGRMHAIWALAKIDGLQAIESLLRMAQADAESAVRVQAIRAIADLADLVLVQHKLDAGRGDPKVAQSLASLPNRAEPSVLLEIVVAFGRMRWAEAPEWLLKNLSKPDDALAHAAMQTLRRADNWPAVLKILDQPDDSPMRTIALRALSDRYEPTVVDGLIARLDAEKSNERRRQYGTLLTRIYKKPGPWKYWGYRPGPRPVNTESWQSTPAIETALDAALHHVAGAPARGLFTVMTREKVPVRTATLRQWLDNETNADTVAVILTALKDHPLVEMRKSLESVVRNRSQRADNRITALTMLVNEKDVDRLALFADHAKSLEDGAVLAHVLRQLALEAHPDDAYAAIIEPKLKSGDAEVRAAAMWALGQMSNTRAAPQLVRFLQDKDVRVRRAAASAAHLSNDDDRVIQLLIKLGSDPDVETRRNTLLALRTLNDGNCAPLAAAALRELPLTSTALLCLRDRGSAKYASAVIDLARRDLRRDILANAIMTLSDWSKSDDTLNGAIAELQGMHGNLIRWRATGPVPADERLKTIDLLNKSMAHPKRQGHFFFGIGDRVELSRNVNPKTPLWFAQTDVTVPTATSVEFLGASGGSFEVFLNGKSIHRRAKPAKFQTDSDRFNATLEKGVNYVLVQTGESLVVEFGLHFRRKSSKAEHEKLSLAALSRAGNAERGRKIFFDKEKAQCIKCHRMDDQGERIGPELTGVGARFSRIHIIESILEPSRTIAPSFGTYAIALKSGKTLSGVKLAETETAVTLADNQGVKHELSKRDIDEMNLSAVSTMPDGLEQRLTVDEFVDLIGFLASQKEKGTVRIR